VKPGTMSGLPKCVSTNEVVTLYCGALPLVIHAHARTW